MPCEGLRWLDRAARGGHPPAQFDLARAYRGGFGVSRDDSLAYRWALKASQAGHALARAELRRFSAGPSHLDPAAANQSLAQPPPAFILPLPRFEILLWFSRLYLDADSCAAFPANP
ncbi:MAG: tetratricopeptide repeat protein [Bryobacteraceae bacterium]